MSVRQDDEVMFKRLSGGYSAVNDLLSVLKAFDVCPEDNLSRTQLWFSYVCRRFNYV